MRHGWLASAPAPLRALRNDAIGAAIAGLAVVLVVGLGGAFAEPTARTAASVLLAGLHFATLALRRASPIAFALLNAVLAGIGYPMLAGPDLIALVLVLVGVYSVAAFAPKRWHALGLLSLPFAVALLLIDIVVLADGAADPIALAIVVAAIAAVYLAAWALGYARRGHFETQAQERERLRLLERDAHRLAELAVADERTRISREMHDIIAHSLASIITLAEGGRMAASRDPELGTRLFERIGDAGRDALDDVKRLLRNVEEGQGDAPAHGVDELPDLVGTAALGGLPIVLAIDGRPRPLPTGLSLAVYRVAQESITNVLKHAPGARTEVRLRWPHSGEEPPRLELEIENELPDGAAPGAGTGRGLTGMRERVELFDGELGANRTGGRFHVRAALPLPAE
ncbi:MAG: two-component sensor histidine kinase [Microbacteriaceae bacterium]|nr:two-component sensor histidine kinase [Microbacteriaceae bacterium]